MIRHAAWIIALVLALGVGGAFAHAEPERATPPIGGTVGIAPKIVEIWFSEEVAEGTGITVIGPDGKSAHAGTAQLDLYDPDRKHMTVNLKPGLGAGVYTVQWKSISAEDGDSDSGGFTFTVAGGTPVAAGTASPAPTISPTAINRVDGAAAVQSTPFPTRELLIAVAVGLGAAAFIYGFWLLVRPKQRKS